jgi:hypothetical protein
VLLQYHNQGGNAVVTGGSVNAGPAIANGTVYWGSGYTHLGFGFGNNKLFAFSRNGK